MVAEVRILVNATVFCHVNGRVSGSVRAALETSMAIGGDPQELEDPPASLRLQVWENFGFPVTYTSTGERVVACFGV